MNVQGVYKKLAEHPQPLKAIQILTLGLASNTLKNYLNIFLEILVKQFLYTGLSLATGNWLL